MLEFINDLFQAGSSLRANVSEIENGYLLNILMPGVDKDDIDIEVEEGNLNVSVRQADGANNTDRYLIHEFTAQATSRSFYLGDIDEESIKARLVNGVLEITVLNKKPDASKKRVINID